MPENDTILTNAVKRKLWHRGISEERLQTFGITPQPGESDTAFIQRALDAVCQQIRKRNPKEIYLRMRTYPDAADSSLDLDLDWTDLFQGREWQPDAWGEVRQALVEVSDALASQVERRVPLRIMGQRLLSAGFVVGSVFSQPSEFRLIARQVHKEDGREDWWDSTSQPLVSTPVPSDPLVLLRQYLTSYFNDEELRTLCFDLQVPYEDLQASAREGRARELVSYMERRSRAPELIAKCAELRPKVAWPNLNDPSTLPDMIYTIVKDDARVRLNFQDAILELSASGNVTEQVDQYVAANSLNYRRRVEVGVQGYNITSSEMAAAVARQVRAALVELKPPSDSGRIHLFANVPAALAILVGRWMNAVGKVQLYEYRDGQYYPGTMLVV